jgi:hypothetical protein
VLLGSGAFCRRRCSDSAVSDIDTVSRSAPLSHRQIAPNFRAITKVIRYEVRFVGSRFCLSFPLRRSKDKRAVNMCNDSFVPRPFSKKSAVNLPEKGENLKRVQLLLLVAQSHGS